MFGYVQANLQDLSQEEQERYRAAYCGLCKALGQRHGLTARLSLTYDMTFLSLLLSSLYEPEEQTGNFRCAVHPVKPHRFAVSECTDYAADMTVALSYHKCLDDWQDDRNLPRRGYAVLLEKPYGRVKERWPEQCGAIESGLRELSQIEQAGREDPDAGANCFAAILEAVFLYRRDRWEEELRAIGRGLGRYIYLADAAVDWEEDQRKGRYNPLASLSAPPQNLRETLMTVLGEASQGFETLPLVQDVHLLRNILYSGVWMKYNQGIQKKVAR
jgi:hypothetical protein